MIEIVLRYCNPERSTLVERRRQYDDDVLTTILNFDYSA